MASESLDGCIKLIEPQSNGNFEVTETGERLLSRQNEKCPCNMVFIFGNARSGKSFLMNRLLAQSSSALKDYNPFKVINQHLPCTKGADLACRFIAHSALTGESSELSSKDGAVSVGFVDVEGQGDAGETHDTLLALPLLLTSKIVLFNHKGAPTVSHMLERLGKNLLCSSRNSFLSLCIFTFCIHFRTRRPCSGSAARFQVYRRRGRWRRRKRGEGGGAFVWAFAYMLSRLFLHRNA